MAGEESEETTETLTFLRSWSLLMSNIAITSAPKISSAPKSLVSAVAAVLTASLLAAPASAQEPPDLVALSVQGPGQAQLGSSASVNTFIVNLGGPLVGDIEFDILLTNDLVIDGGDTVVLAHSTAFVGALNVPVTIPMSLSPGTYNWAIRVSPQATEVTTFNNEVIGGQVQLFVLDLCVDSNAPIVASTVQGGDNPSGKTLEISNCGTGGAILIFNASVEPAVPWLSVSPTTSFVVAGGQPQKVEVKFNAAGLSIGDHVTSLRLANFADASDFELIPITLTIGEARFDVGDSLIGEIFDPADTDVARFDMIAGEKMMIKFTTSFGNIKPLVEILGAGDVVLESWTFKTSAKNSKQTFKAKANGEYRIRISGRLGTLGAYVVKTSRKLPKAAQEKHLKIKADSSGTVEVAVRALAGATLDFSAEPKGKNKATLAAQLADPIGTILDISALVQETATGGVLAVGIPLEDLGDYILSVDGVAAGKTVKVTIVPTQPAPGIATVLIP